MRLDASQFLRLLAWDFRLQRRYYIWFAGVFMTVLWSLLFIWIPEDGKSVWLPVLLFTDTCTIGLLFIAGLILLERQQGTLSAISVMPVPTWAWLASKILSQSLFCSTMAIGIVIFHSGSVDWLQLIPAIFMGSVVYSCLGFLLVCPFQKLTNFFLVMSLTISVCGLPVLAHLEVYQHGLMWLIPTMPFLKLLEAGFNTDTSSVSLLWLSTLLLSIWIALSFYLSIKAFHRYISQRHGN